MWGTLLKAGGFTVLDIGIDVSSENFIKEINEKKGRYSSNVCFFNNYYTECCSIGKKAFKINNIIIIREVSYGCRWF